MKRIVAGIAIGLGILAVGCGRPAQIGPDEGVFKAVDALFTAVSLRDPKLLEQCEAQLKGQRAEGKLPEGAADALDSIIEEARTGDWVPAQERLRSFMLGQRR